LLPLLCHPYATGRQAKAGKANRFRLCVLRVLGDPLGDPDLAKSEVLKDFGGAPSGPFIFYDGFLS